MQNYYSADKIIVCEIIDTVRKKKAFFYADFPKMLAKIIRYIL